MLPDFILIGAMKSGTTSLHHYLGLHPEISMARLETGKELNFFVQELNYPRGVPWYEARFTGMAPVHGEASVSYTKHPEFRGVPERMHALVPGAKLIYLLRDPVSRIISHYTHNYLEGSESRAPGDIFSSLESNPYIDCSRYYFQLAQYLPFYPREKILIITSEELKDRRQSTLQTIFHFLGVDDSFFAPGFEDILYRTSDRRKKNRLGRYLSELRVTQRHKHLLSTRLFRLSKKMVGTRFEQPWLEKALEDRLIEYLKPDVDLLRKYADMSFGGWRV